MGAVGRRSLVHALSLTHAEVVTDNEIDLDAMVKLDERYRAFARYVVMLVNASGYSIVRRNRIVEVGCLWLGAVYCSSVGMLLMISGVTLGVLLGGPLVVIAVGLASAGIGYATQGPAWGDVDAQILQWTKDMEGGTNAGEADA